MKLLAETSCRGDFLPKNLCHLLPTSCHTKMARSFGGENVSYSPSLYRKKTSFLFTMGISRGFFLLLQIRSCSRLFQNDTKQSRTRAM